MESVGQKLRDERLRQGLALDDVSASTRISVKNLQAIENDDLTQINSAFFYKSFARQFADYLGVEFSHLSEAVQDSAKSMPEPLVPGQSDVPLPNVPSLQAGRPRSSRWLLSLTSLVAVLVACSALSAMWKTVKYNDLQTATIQWVDSLSRRFKASPAPQTAADNRSQSDVRTESQPPIPAAPDQSEQNASGFHVQVSALEKTWLSIVSDGKNIYSGVLEADESKILEGRESASIKTGNAGGVDVIFNGREIGPLGPKGQVRTVVFTKNNYEIVPPPAHIALTAFTTGVE
jgi:cytoskeletal protein RodZ